VRANNWRKFCKQRRNQRGVNPTLGASWDDVQVGQCPRCDKGQRRKCWRLPHCSARRRSPNGTNRREQGRSTKRAAKAARKAARNAESRAAWHRRMRHLDGPQKIGKSVKHTYDEMVGEEDEEDAEEDEEEDEEAEMESYMRRLRFDGGDGPGAGGGPGAGLVA